MAQIINILTFDISELLWRVKFVLIILSVLFGASSVYFFIQMQKLVKLKISSILNLYASSQPTKVSAVQSRWEEIVRHAQSQREAEWKLAVIEADKLVDDLLKLAGYQGETMGDRLMSIEQGQLESLSGLWEAHKIRNKLVHETNYFLRPSEAQRAILLYERAMKELYAL